MPPSLRSTQMAWTPAANTRPPVLHSTEFLYEVVPREDAAYLFKHALTEEVAYASLTREARRQLRGRLVEAIETAYAGRLEEHFEELARHALRAKRWKEVFSYNREAAKKARGCSIWLSAAQCDR